MASDVLILLGFIAAVVGILVIGVYFIVRFKNQRRAERDRQIKGLHLSSSRRSGSSRSSRSSPNADDDADDDADDGGDDGGDESESGDGRVRRRVRRRRRDHRPRNPSLAEAGGLPPVRPEDSAPPA